MKGSIVKRARADGTTAYTVVYRADGKQHWKAFDRQKDAHAFLTGQVKTVQDGTHVRVRQAPMAAILDGWVKRHVEVQLKLGALKPSTVKSYRSMVHVHLRPTFGAVSSDKLGRRHVSDWVARLADQIADGDLTPKTYNNLLNLLHGILAWARLERYLQHDPLIGQTRLPKVKVERDFLQPEEIDRLLTAASAKPYLPADTLLRLAVYGGFRRGELFSLKWSDVDWGTGAGGTISVGRSTYQGTVTGPKTQAGFRRVDVPQFVLADLDLYRTMYPPKPGNLLFRSGTGAALDPDNWSKRVLTPILEAAGLRRITLHVLRHTYASLLINQGESIKYVSRQLGHASIQITADLYAHLFKETSVAAMKRLEEGVTIRSRTESA